MDLKNKGKKIIITIFAVLIGSILVYFIAKATNVSTENLGIVLISAITGVVLTTLGILWGKDILHKITSHSVATDNLDSLIDNQEQIAGKSEANSLASEDILDEILKEIRRFVYDWNRRLPWNTGYRRLIETSQIGTYLVRISEQAQRMQRQTKRLKDMKLIGTKPIVDNFSNLADRLVDLGVEVETTFQTIKLKKDTLKKDPDKIKKIISDGDTISQDFKKVISDLEKLRKKL